MTATDCRRHGMRHLGIVALFLSPQALAYHLDYSLELALEHSDNIRRSETDEIGQSVLIPRLSFDWQENGGTLQAHAAGIVEYRDYLQGAFDNELRGQVSGIFNWIVFPERMSWTLEDYVGREPVNVLATATPDNQQTTNVFITGPTLRLRLGPTQRLQAELRFIDSNAQTTKQFDSERVSFALRDVLELNPTSKLSANLEAQHVHPTDVLGGETYDRYDLFGRYDNKLARLDLQAALGLSKINFDQRDDASGVLASLKAGWRVTPRDTLSFELDRRFADAAIDLIQDPNAIGATAAGVGSGSNTINSQVFRESRGELGFAHNSERLRLHLAPYYRKLDYVDEPSLNQTGEGGTAQVEYALTQRLHLTAYYGLERHEYTLIERTDRDSSYGLRLSDQWTRHWSWRLEIGRSERDSNASGQSYEESLVFLSFVFRR
jgi:Putative beta-barrel porin 2